MSVQIKYEVLLYKLGFAPSNNFLFDGGIRWGATGVGSTRFLGHWLYDFRPQQDFGIDKVVILPLNESNAYENIAYCDYMRIRPQKDGEQNAFSEWDYFITKIERIANESIRLTMKMDTLNTFREIVLNHLTAKTMIKREHKDRFKQATITLPFNGFLYNVIDDVSEGFKPVKYQTSKVTVQDASKAGISANWYLIYKTTNTASDLDAANPVDCYLCGDSSLLIKTGASGSVVTWNYGDLSESCFYYVTYVEDPSGIVTMSGTSRTINSTDYTTYNAQTGITYRWNIRGFAFYRSGTQIYCYVLGAQVSGSGNHNIHDVVIVDETFGGNALIASSIVLTSVNYVFKTFTLTDQFSIIQSGESLHVNSGTSANLYLKPISDIRRDDSHLVKIMKLPYCPVAVSADSGGQYDFGDNWEYADGLMHLKNLDADFKNEGFNLVEISNFKTSVNISNLSSAYQTSRFIIDPKLSHSDFHTEKFAYDSFSLEFQLEKMKLNALSAASYDFYFKPTNTINSNFEFKFSVIGASYTASDDYHVLLSSRNNELPIYTNSWINYLRTGFNYDKKAKAISTASNWINAGLSIGGAIGGVVLGAAGGPIGAAVAGGAVISSLSTLANSISGQIQQENTYEEKLSTLRAQSASVAGSDDIDLLTDYSENKLIYFKYDASQNVRKMLDDLFYYFGYACNYQAIPDFTSRTWFNFVQCEPVFDIATTSTILPVYLDDLSARLKEGVTCLHFHRVNTSQTIQSYYDNYDFNQVRENYERWILGL